MVYEDSICSDREITLRLYLDSRFPSNVYGYASLLRQALCEIIENAVGRARTGGIISVHCRADRPSGGLVNLYFRIDDDGKRIPETGMQAMFEAEDPADAASAGRSGLYAAQEAAALMGGSLNARSSSGSTRFLLTVALRVR
jgi:signal transduction histidine kinase